MCVGGYRYDCYSNEVASMFCELFVAFMIVVEVSGIMSLYEGTDTALL